jgi:hypothetical protein
MTDNRVLAPHKEPAEQGEQCPVGGLEPRPRHLASEDLKLMAEDEDLEVLLELGHASQPDEVDDAKRHPEEKRQGHGQSLPSQR